MYHTYQYNTTNKSKNTDNRNNRKNSRSAAERKTSYDDYDAANDGDDDLNDNNNSNMTKFLLDTSREYEGVIFHASRYVSAVVNCCEIENKNEMDIGTFAHDPLKPANNNNNNSSGTTPVESKNDSNRNLAINTKNDVIARSSPSHAAAMVIDFVYINKQKLNKTRIFCFCNK